MTTLVSSTPDGTPADVEVPAISAVMRDDGRIVALGGGFQALWPLTAGVVTYPWVIRDLESQHLHAGPGAARPPGPAELSCRPPKSPGSRQTGNAYILSDRAVAGQLGLLGFKSGTTVEYDIAGNRIIQRLPGFRQPTGERLRRRPVIATDHAGRLLAFVPLLSRTVSLRPPSPDG